jgi:hypothetical protein
MDEIVLHATLSDVEKTDEGAFIATFAFGGIPGYMATVSPAQARTIGAHLDEDFTLTVRLVPRKAVVAFGDDGPSPAPTPEAEAKLGLGVAELEAANLSLRKQVENLDGMVTRQASLIERVRALLTFHEKTERTYGRSAGTQPRPPTDLEIERRVTELRDIVEAAARNAQVVGCDAAIAALSTRVRFSQDAVHAYVAETVAKMVRIDTGNALTHGPRAFATSPEDAPIANAALNICGIVAVTAPSAAELGAAAELWRHTLTRFLGRHLPIPEPIAPDDVAEPAKKEE